MYSDWDREDDDHHASAVEDYDDSKDRPRAFMVSKAHANDLGIPGITTKFLAETSVSSVFLHYDFFC